MATLGNIVMEAGTALKLGGGLGVKVAGVVVWESGRRMVGLHGESDGMLLLLYVALVRPVVLVVRSEPLTWLADAGAVVEHESNGARDGDDVFSSLLNTFISMTPGFLLL